VYYEQLAQGLLPGNGTAGSPSVEWRIQRPNHYTMRPGERGCGGIWQLADTRAHAVSVAGACRMLRRDCVEHLTCLSV